MTSRKLRPTRAGGSKKKVPNDVSPSTSLPPLVEGQLRCFLRVTISRVLWTAHKPPSPTFIRLRWWGESSNGTHFFPRDDTQLSQKAIRITACFPIRCGSKQFTSYLTDMGSLVLEVLTKPDHLPIARAQVAGIAGLSLSHPISGFYSLVSPTADKLGELQVSLNLEPLTEAYDSGSSAPPTDNMPDPSGILSVNTLTMPSQHVPAASPKESCKSSGGNTPRGKDLLYFQNAQKEKEDTLENQTPTNSQRSANVTNRDASHGQSPGDILSVILERGNKLRNAMVASALKSEVDSHPALKDTPLPLPKDNIQPLLRSFPPHSGTFVGNILHTHSSLKQSDVALVSESGLNGYVDIGDRAVDLLLGSSVASPPVRVGPHCLSDSPSDHNSVCGDNELSDSQYDESLLENLFYKTPILDLTSEETGMARHRPSSSSSSTLNQKSPQSGSKRIKSAHLAQPHTTDAGGLHRLLDKEQFALLRSARRLRVTIDSLTVPAESSTTSPWNTRRPPRPPTSKKCTYFVEYHLPETSSSSRCDRNGEVTRVVSSKVSKGVVKFEQTSVFSVHLSTAAVQQWCETDLTFKIYSRKANQKKAVSIGKAVHPLRCLLQNKQLSQTLDLPVHSETLKFGPLKVTLQLEADVKSFSEKTKKQVVHRDVSPPQAALSPPRETSPRRQHAHTVREESQSHSMTSEPNVRTPPKPSQDYFPHPGLFTSCKPFQRQQEEPQVLLHALLMVPDGKNFTSGNLQAPNIYLNCKLFECDEMTRSVVSWGQTNPVLNFVQVTPVALTSKLLERMRNNMMMIEVWQKTGHLGNDQLVGLVRLPLHQFYMSFRDPKITHLLLQAQYPVVAVDCYMPVIDVFSGSCRGNLRVVLAMGQSEQIVSLQRSRDEECDSFPRLVRPVHLLDQQRQSQQKVAVVQVEAMTEHLFVIKVEKVYGLTPLQSTVWGEADCYVQYSFPCQGGDSASEVDQNIPESSANLKPFRTTTTLCIPDPLFGHTETHVLLTPEDVPVQRLLLSSLSGQGLSSGGGIQFEVWCRYYYPNVRDQLVARGLMPLSKLCAMVTMQGQQPNEGQRFSLPLIPIAGDATSHHHPSGLLDVCVRYKHRPLRHEAQPGRGTASRMVTLVLQVHRACGLKAAARLIAEKDERFGYFAGVGLNPYVTVQLSLMPETEKRCTRTVARTFCPEFDHHAEVACDLLVQRSSGESCSLAEQLDQASAVFTVWNRDNRKALNVSRPKEVMLGSVKIPLADLIHKRTGISGWFGICSTQETSSSKHQHTLVGGLEISIHFAHHSDRERVIKAARGLAWEIDRRESASKDDDDDETWEEGMRKVSMMFSVPRAWIPLHCLLLPGHTELLRSTYCYFRYKFYDQEAFCSQMKHPSVNEGAEEDQAAVSFEGSRTVGLTGTQPLMWYLREERLEVQVWVAFKKDKVKRPSNTDRLVGSAFVDLSSLAKTNQQKLTLSGVYPLFKRSAADLQGAALRVHITLMEDIQHREESEGGGTLLSFDSQEEASLEEVEEADEAPCPTIPTVSRQLNEFSRETPDITSVQQSETSVDESFPVTVTVDRAMHLNLKGCPLAERSADSPCCCVSYITADSAEPVSTAVVANTASPVWEHQHECRLSKELLVDPQQSLVFKVWHKGDMERVIGFAPVDLSPLLCGFPSVCGWYNITDFSGQCHGQLKVSVTPLRGIHYLREQRRTVDEETVEDSSSIFQAVPLSYHTTATYSSFPSHISRYPEQNISSPDHTEKLFSERSSESDRHLEHMDKVRLYHQILHERAAHVNPSTSMLLSTLRKKLDELDNIQRYFSRKLSAPTFPSMVEHDADRSHKELNGPQSDTSHLLLKSTQLVGQVNDIIGGLRGTNLDMIPSSPQRGSSLGVEDENLHTNCSPRSVSHCPPEGASQFSSPPPETLGGHAESEEETSVRICEVKACEENSASSSEADEEEKDEDYEEVVVKPKPLNDVTSITDRTSPWTSVLSDPDLVSLESLDAPEGPSLSEDDEDEGLTENPDARTRGSSQKRSEGRHSFTDSEAETDDEKTLQSLHERPDDEDSEELDPSPVPDTHNASGSTNNQDTKLQHTVPPEVPNFFLSSHQLEASMRAIRLAPSFSQTTSNPTRGASARRGPRLRPALSPSSMKKETERIAKIFAAHSDQTREDGTL